MCVCGCMLDYWKPIGDVVEKEVVKVKAKVKVKGEVKKVKTKNKVRDEKEWKKGRIRRYVSFGKYVCQGYSNKLLFVKYGIEN